MKLLRALLALLLVSTSAVALQRPYGAGGVTINDGGPESKPCAGC